MLGIFGRYDVGLAAYWALNQDETFAWAGFRVYRNYDDAGSRFGDTSIFGASDDAALGSVYGSIDADNPSRCVLVVINKSDSAKTAAVRIAHPTAYGQASVWVLSGNTAELASGPDLAASADNAFLYTMPALSVSVIVPAP